MHLARHIKIKMLSLRIKDNALIAQMISNYFFKQAWIDLAVHISLNIQELFPTTDSKRNCTLQQSLNCTKFQNIYITYHIRLDIEVN